MSEPLPEAERRKCQARLVAYSCWILSGQVLTKAVAEFNRAWNNAVDKDSVDYIHDVASS